MVPSGKVSACATGTSDEDDAMAKGYGEAVQHQEERSVSMVCRWGHDVDADAHSGRVLKRDEEDKSIDRCGRGRGWSAGKL